MIRSLVTALVFSTLTGCSLAPGGKAPPDDPGIAIRRPIDEPDTSTGGCSVEPTDAGATLTCSDGSSAVVSNGAPGPAGPAGAPGADGLQGPPGFSPVISTTVDEDTGCTVLTSTVGDSSSAVGTVCPPDPYRNPDTQVIFFRGGGRFARADFVLDANTTAADAFPETVLGEISISSQGEWFDLTVKRGGTCTVTEDGGRGEINVRPFDIAQDPGTQGCIPQFRGLPTGDFYAPDFFLLDQQIRQGGGVFFLPAGEYHFSVVLPTLSFTDGQRVRGLNVNYVLAGTLRRLHVTEPPKP